MLSIYLNYRKRRDIFALYHEERMTAMEKGVDLPPLPDDFFHEEVKPSRRSSHGTLLTGLILVFVGAIFYFALLRDETINPNRAIYALIPTGIGAACLIYYFTVGRKLALAAEAERKARLEQTTRVRNPTA
jgi:hypothetical protein